MILELTPINRAIIQAICKYEHDSLLRLHSGTSELSEELPQVLDALGLTEEDYMDYSSDAYYEFQKVLDNPEELFQMPPLFMAVFINVAACWKNKLLDIYGDYYAEFITNVTILAGIVPSPLNFN